MLLGCRQTGAPRVPLPGQWELAQEAALVQSGLDRWGQRGYQTGRLWDTGRALRLSGRVGRRNGPPRTPSPQLAGTWGGQADGEEPQEPQRAGCERFYVLGHGKLLIMDFRLDRAGAVMLGACWAEQKLCSGFAGGGRSGQQVQNWAAVREVGARAGGQGGKQRCAPRRGRCRREGACDSPGGGSEV